MYMHAYVGYLIVIAKVVAMISDGCTEKCASQAEIPSNKDIFSAIPVDISANMAYAFKHEGADKKTQRILTLLPLGP
jgi:hypothetical protein